MISLIRKLVITTSGSGRSWDNGNESITQSATWLALPLEKKAPTAAIIDSQSIRTASQPGVRGDDAGKKITGRKRHILVDTQGNILALKVPTADVQDRDGAKLFLNVLTMAFGWLMLIWANLVEQLAGVRLRGACGFTERVLRSWMNVMTSNRPCI